MFSELGQQEMEKQTERETETERERESESSTKSSVGQCSSAKKLHIYGISIYDEWAEGTERGGWEDRSGQTNSSGKEQRAQTTTPEKACIQSIGAA
eukprot:283191-Amphidinium_carterae.1